MSALLACAVPLCPTASRASQQPTKGPSEIATAIHCPRLFWCCTLGSCTKSCSDISRIGAEFSPHEIPPFKLRAFLFSPSRTPNWHQLSPFQTSHTPDPPPPSAPGPTPSAVSDVAGPVLLRLSWLLPLVVVLPTAFCIGGAAACVCWRGRRNACVQTARACRWWAWLLPSRPAAPDPAQHDPSSEAASTVLLCVGQRVGVEAVWRAERNGGDGPLSGHSSTGPLGHGCHKSHFTGSTLSDAFGCLVILRFTICRHCAHMHVVEYSRAQGLPRGRLDNCCGCLAPFSSMPES